MLARVSVLLPSIIGNGFAINMCVCVGEGEQNVDIGEFRVDFPHEVRRED